MHKNNTTFQVLMITVLATIAGVMGISMPIIAVAYPILLTLIGVKNGIKYNIISLIISCALVGVISGSIESVLILIEYGILSLGATYMINKRYKPSQIMVGSTLLILGTSIIYMGLEWYITGINYVTGLENSLALMSEEILKQGNFPPNEISNIKSLLNNMTNYIVVLMPALLIVSSTVVAYINYLIPTKLLRKLGREDIYVPYFSRLIFPKNIMSGLGVIFILTFLLRYFGNINYEQMMLNVVVLIFYIFILEGLSLVVFLMNKAKMAGFLKYLLVVIIILSGFLNLALFSIGIIDSLVDFRKLRDAENL
ncbi:hypothetical membrane DUF2232 [Gottschalkia acidurici 9a]|uniref:Hypothetical membrane DUF2232 n=1 Tax=Gottschalkia acidurici (strain ATCC 7906 / DSM 604 / BCRC 14475 / CIP 104303 / KCTC 5404 / NCIMB 10678 / 9a) TaxID=1128398 RepID=K0B3Z3_GOTA9|nr:DUF2232 domain-containing protein [Gottschalkia acidurici]AFS79842.1 hypothetical membrane DUF2232 [Gottschalkia acidurici 9a]